MELTSVEQSAIFHFKDSKLVTVTYTNSHNQLYPLGEPMTRKEIEEFYETNKLKNPL